MDQGLMGTQREAFPGLKTLNERRLQSEDIYTATQNTPCAGVC